MLSIGVDGGVEGRQWKSAGTGTRMPIEAVCRYNTEITYNTARGQKHNRTQKKAKKKNQAYRW